ncbi:MAG TPA: isochorismatase family protein [Armatimonadota bacterium]|jgi:nicotinamidase/pyrazinamidase|nr:isochorismatase family protein [Armatimonadota bacterium]HPP74337.1 isochorismatase family protein [Armatimonadota bacterium]
MADKALVIIDVQKCFLPGGPLAVEEGDKVVPVLNEYIKIFKNRGLPIFATRDWHPPVTKHFKEYGGLWPPHCIRDTPGAEFAPGLELPEDTEIISAGVGPEEEGYSSFEGANEDGESFEEVLRSQGILHLYVGGIATDYCVKETTLDALRKGFKATLLQDAVKAVNLKPGDDKRAIDDMVEAGAKVSELEEVRKELESTVRTQI